MIIESICAFGLVGCSCEMGQRFTTEFDDVGDAVDKLNWYLFPIGVQRLLPTVIISAQQQLTIECFGSVSCQRESFKKVSIAII